MRKAPAYDAAEFLDSPEVIAEYLNEALATGDPELIVMALGTVGRAVGMTDVARKADVSRENLYRALGGEAKPEFATVMRVLSAVGVRLTATPRQGPPVQELECR